MCDYKASIQDDRLGVCARERESENRESENQSVTPSSMSPFMGCRGHGGRRRHFICERRRCRGLTAESQAFVRRKVDGREVYPVRWSLPRGIHVTADLGANNNDDDRWIHALKKHIGFNSKPGQ